MEYLEAGSLADMLLDDPLDVESVAYVMHELLTVRVPDYSILHVDDVIRLLHICTGNAKYIVI